MYDTVFVVDIAWHWILYSQAWLPASISQVCASQEYASTSCWGCLIIELKWLWLWSEESSSYDMYYIMSGKLNPTKQLLIFEFLAFMCFFWIFFYYNLIPSATYVRPVAASQHLFSCIQQFPRTLGSLSMMGFRWKLISILYSLAYLSFVKPTQQEYWPSVLQNKGTWCDIYL